MNFTFCGCSFTQGVGLKLEKDDINNYSNIIATNFNAATKNLAKGGNSNYNIFMSALSELLNSPPDVLFVQWTALNRLWLYPGPDTELFLGYTVTEDYTYRDIYYTKSEMQKMSDQYHTLNHDYHNLMVLIDYCNILEKVATNTKIVFIDGLIPWTKEIYDTTTVNDYSKNLSEYSKQLFEFDLRDDAELNSIFVRLNNHITDAGNSNWVNMFNSMIKQKIDLGNDGSHPGPKSHRLYADMIIKYLESGNGN